MKMKYRFLYRIGDRYHWESVLPMPGDSRHVHVSCPVSWFFSGEDAE